MSTTIRASYEASISVVETVDGYVLAGDNTLSFGISEADALTAGTAVPATKKAGFAQALTAGAATIDLTALPGRNADEIINGTGLKVQLAFFRNKSTNANDIVITFGAANPYLLNGAAFKTTLKPNQWVMFGGEEAAPDIGGASKTIDITGTGAQVLECFFVMG